MKMYLTNASIFMMFADVTRGVLRDCQDRHAGCSAWAEDGECFRNSDFMTAICPQSCKDCEQSRMDVSSQSDCVDVDEKCSVWAKAGECTENPDYMHALCPLSCVVCTSSYHNENLGPSPDESGSVARGNDDLQAIQFKGFHCDDTDKHCRYWAKQGECETNPTFMRVYCRRSCSVCDPSPEDPLEHQEDEKLKLPCTDLHHKCQPWAKDGYCDLKPEFMHTYCRSSCQSCDRSEHCVAWEFQGECQKNPEYMMKECRMTCLESTPSECRNLWKDCTARMRQGHCLLIKKT